MNLGEKLLRWREKMGFTQTDAASFFGVSTKSYQFWEYGRTEPRPSKIRQIREAIETNQVVEPTSQESIKILLFKNNHWFLDDTDQHYISIIKQFCDTKSKHCVLLTMVGDNMSPGLLDGDLIVAEQVKRIDRDARYVLLTNDRKTLMVKRCQIRGDVVKALSDNTQFPDITIKEGDVYVVGRILYPNDIVASRH